MDSFTTSVTGVAATGNLKQVYSPFCTAGSGSTATGTQKRRPVAGSLFLVEVQTDGVNGGTIEVFDINGELEGADVDTSDVITNAQLTSAIAANRAVKMFTQQFAGSGTARLAINRGTRFSKGLALRFVAAAGSCIVNIQWEGGQEKIWVAGL